MYCLRCEARCMCVLCGAEIDVKSQPKAMPQLVSKTIIQNIQHYFFLKCKKRKLVVKSISQRDWEAT